MEPLIELATRITSQLWYLHGLFPTAARLEGILNWNWRALAEPHSYSELQTLLDLTDVQAAWTATEWFCEYESPSEPENVAPPRGYRPEQLLTRARYWYRE